MKKKTFIFLSFMVALIHHISSSLHTNFLEEIVGGVCDTFEKHDTVS